MTKKNVKTNMTLCEAELKAVLKRHSCSIEAYETIRLVHLPTDTQKALDFYE